MNLKRPLRITNFEEESSVVQFFIIIIIYLLYIIYYYHVHKLHVFLTTYRRSWENWKAGLRRPSRHPSIVVTIVNVDSVRADI